MVESGSRSGWTDVAFGDVVQLSRERSGDPEKDGFERYVGLEHLEPGDMKIRRWGQIADGTTFTSVFRSGQVLFGKRRAYQRKVAVADFDGVCSGDIYVLEPKNDQLLPDLLPFVCRADGFFQYAVGTSAGSLSPRTNWKNLALYEFALPPLKEQRRIAVILRAIHTTVESHMSLHQAAECVRTSFASSVFSGPSSDRMERPDAGARPGGRALELRQLVAPGGLVRGPFGGSLKKEVLVDEGYMVYEQSHAITGNVTTGRYFVGERKYREMKRFQVRDGDLIMSCSGTIGRVAQIHAGCPSGIINQALLKVRPDPGKVDSRYLLEYLSSDVFAQSLARLSMGSAMSNVASVRQLERIAVPLPPLHMQREIADMFGRQGRAIAGIAQRLESASRLLADATTAWLGPAR